MSISHNDQAQIVLTIESESDVADRAPEQLVQLLRSDQDLVEITTRHEQKKQAVNRKVTLKFHLSDEQLAALLLSMGQRLAQMGRGGALVDVIDTEELTTTQAAAFLKVSRPYLIGLLEKGEIPYRKVGTHRRILRADVLQYRREITEKRYDTLRDLSELSEELGLDD